MTKENAMSTMMRVTASEKAVLEQADAERGLDVADIFRERLNLWLARHHQRKSAR
jgi:hypothetical protein